MTKSNQQRKDFYKKEYEKCQKNNTTLEEELDFFKFVKTAGLDKETIATNYELRQKLTESLTTYTQLREIHEGIVFNVLYEDVVLCEQIIGDFVDGTTDESSVFRRKTEKLKQLLVMN